MFKTIPTLLCDFYKLSHREQYPQNTTLVYSNFTPRNDKYFTNISSLYDSKVVFFGLQYFLKNLNDMFNENFFNCDLEDVIFDYDRIITYCLGQTEPNTSHIEELHQLGYLPLEIKALPEGTRIHCKIPVLTIINTHPDFYWLTNFIETLLSSELWIMCNNATIAYEYNKLCNHWADKTCDNKEHVQFQCHDFSFRGMPGHQAAMMSSMAHLTSFVGTDTIPAILGHQYYYNCNVENELIGCSIPASEHSVMSAGGQDTELQTYDRFITDLYPNGLVAIVSDTWNIWNVCTDILPKLKDKIMARDGKIVIRPDSGDPADIICGLSATIYSSNKDTMYHTAHDAKGVIQLLWDTFGGSVNEKGYKVLDSHIGCIYGDSITVECAEHIFQRLEYKGFAASNIVFGVGSYTYQYNTRDSQGWAVKATYCEVDGKGINIFKDPITDKGKKSAKGLLRVEKIDNDYKLHDEQSWIEENLGELKTVYKNGKLINETNLLSIRQKLKG